MNNWYAMARISAEHRSALMTGAERRRLTRGRQEDSGTKPGYVPPSVRRLVSAIVRLIRLNHGGVGGGRRTALPAILASRSSSRRKNPMCDNSRSDRPTPSLIVIATVIGALLLAYSFAQTPEGVSSSPVYRFADMSEVEGGSSRLIRSADAVSMELQTVALEPNAPYTIWWVVFNQPENCSGACNGDDLFNADGTLNLNEGANVSILFADGAMSAADGAGSFTAVLPEGRQLGELVLGPGLVDSTTAEVHLVVRSHGPTDLSRLYEQLSTFEPGPLLGGTCAVCQDQHFAVHRPGGN